LAGKSQQCAEKVQQANNEYQSTLGATNAKQNEFYKMQQPQLLQVFFKKKENNKIKKRNLMKLILKLLFIILIDFFFLNVFLGISCI